MLATKPETSIKKLQRVRPTQTIIGSAMVSPCGHFGYSSLGAVISPFPLLDYAGPVEFQPVTKRHGVGEHPHRGFETVTIVYSGEVEHRDSSGGGRIGPGACSG